MKSEQTKYVNKELNRIFESGVNKAKIAMLINDFVIKFKLKDVPLNNYVPYQLCPRCKGEYRREQCDICEGEKIIPMHNPKILV